MKLLSKIVVSFVVKRLSKKDPFSQSFLSDRKEKNGVGKIEREVSLV